MSRYVLTGWHREFGRVTIPVETRDLDRLINSDPDVQIMVEDEDEEHRVVLKKTVSWNDIEER